MTEEFIRELEKEMLDAAEKLDFERAAQLRDRVRQLKEKVGEPVPENFGSRSTGGAKKKRRRRSARR